MWVCVRCKSRMLFIGGRAYEKVGKEEGRQASRARGEGIKGKKRGEEKELSDCRWFWFGWRVEL